MSFFFYEKMSQIPEDNFFLRRVFYPQRLEAIFFYGGKQTQESEAYVPKAIFLEQFFS